MIYDFKCNKCSLIKELVLHHSEVRDYPCECGGVLKRYFGNQKMIIHGLENLNKEIFDQGANRWIPASRRDEIGKAEGKVWISDKEAEQEAKKNKDHIMKEDDKQFRKNVRKDLERVVNKW